MQMTLDTFEPGSRDRAGFTLFGSALVHMIVILGIGFTFSLTEPGDRTSRTMATTLASAQTSDQVEDAEVFAQSAQEGGGLSDVPEPVRSPIPLVDDPLTRVEKTTSGRSGTPETRVAQTFLMVELPSDVLLALESDTSTPRDDPDISPQEESESMIRSPLATALDREFSAGLEVPRQKFISSRTREHKYASYMESWRARVEQVGNTNYPEEARARRLSGNLVLDVAIRADGSVHDVTVVRSSGQKMLDDAAVRIVMMAAPFKAFPQEILEEVDLLHITRTWQFLRNSALIGN